MSGRGILIVFWGLPTVVIGTVIGYAFNLTPANAGAIAGTLVAMYWGLMFVLAITSKDETQAEKGDCRQETDR